MKKQTFRINRRKLDEWRERNKLTLEEIAEASEKITNPPLSSSSIRNLFSRTSKEYFERDTVQHVAQLIGCDPIVLIHPSDTEGLKAFSSPAQDRIPSDATPRLGHSIVKVPVPPTQLFGRDSEIAILQTKLTSGQPRLITIAAPPCVGKTRVGIEVAQQITENTDWNVLWIDLTYASNEDDIACAMVDHLGIGDTAVSHEGPALQQFVAERLSIIGPTLVVLDNFEHLVSAADKSFVIWLQHAQGLRILVTSRRSLGLFHADEEVYLLKPLDHIPFASLESATPEAISDTPAFQLFEQRAERASGGDYILSEQDESDLMVIGRIIAKCGGFPAPIEFAASQVPPVYPDIEDLEDALDLEAFESHDEHHARRAINQSLESIIQRNFSEIEQISLYELSNFPAAFTRPAVNAVIGKEGLNSKAFWDKITRNHLVSVRYAQFDSTIRTWGFYLPIREYCRKQWEAQASDEQMGAYRARFDTFYTKEAARLSLEMRSALRSKKLRELGSIRDNVLVVIGDAIDQKEGRKAIDSLSDIFASFRAHGPSKQFMTLCESIEPLCTGNTDVAELQLLRARMLERTGQFDKAIERLDAAIGLLNRSGEESLLLAQCLEAHGRILSGKWGASYFLEKIEMEKKAKEIYARHGDIRAGLLNHTWKLRWLCRFEEGLAGAEQTYKTCKEIGDPFEIAEALNSWGLLLWHDGQVPAACERFDEALKLFDRIREDNRVAGCHTNWGEALIDMEAFEEAEDHLARGREIFHSVGNKAHLATNLCAQTVLLVRKKEFDDALEFANDQQASVAASEYNVNAITINTAVGTAHLGLSNYDKAVAVLEPIATFLDKIGSGNSLRSFEVQAALFECHSNLGDSDAARTAQASARQIANVRGINENYPHPYLKRRFLALGAP